MACSFEKILSDLKCLTNRLKSSDELSGKIIKDTSYFHEKLKSLNEVQEKITELTEICCANDKKSESDTFSSYVENSNLEELRVENVELQELLRDYQIGVEIMMSKYRDEVSKYMSIADNKPETPKLEPSSSSDACTNSNLMEQKLKDKYENLLSMAALFERGSQDSMVKLEETIRQIKKENDGMRVKLGLLDSDEANNYFNDSELDNYEDDEICGKRVERGGSRSSSLASDTSNRTLV